MSSYDSAFDATISTINQRAANHRNLVVATCGIFLVVIIVAIVGKSFLHLSLATLLVPASGLFFFRDWKLLQDWRSHILNKWASTDLELGIFRQSVMALPHLPDETLKSMMTSLPLESTDVSVDANELPISSESRQLVSELTLMINALRGQLVLLRYITLTTIVFCLVAALYSGSWIPLLGCLVVVLYNVLKKHWISLKARSATKHLSKSTMSENVDTGHVEQCLKGYSLSPFHTVNLNPPEIVTY